jgi:GTP-binding protein Era
VERPSQKGIMIGRRGEMIKRIGSMARQKIEALVECQVYLELFVKVEKDWTKSVKGLEKVGFQKG